MSDKVQRVTKFDAARRQLDTAIELWFSDGDAVSIHTLAYAAYEILHVVSKLRGRKKGLIWDSEIVNEEYRSEWNLYVKKAPNFFKHAKRDATGEIEFDPELNDILLLTDIVAVNLCGEKSNGTELSFTLWTAIHRDMWLTDKGRKTFLNLLGAEKVGGIRFIPKPVFLKAALEALQPKRKRGIKLPG